MSDKFLQTGGGNVNLTNGSLNLFAGIIGANNLQASRPIKTNAVKQLVSEKLDIDDVNNLQYDLKTKDNLDFVKNDIHNNPATGRIKIYAKNDGNMYKKDENGIETGLVGGGGGISYNPSTTAVEDGMIFTDGVSNTLVKNLTGYRYDATNNKLVVPDIETAEHFSIDSTLTNISFNEATQITSIDGTVYTDIIKKNATHTAEIEFENTGTLIINCDDQIDIVANLSKLTLGGNEIISAAAIDITLETPVIKLTQGGVAKNIEITPSLNRINFNDGAILKGYIKQNATNNDIEILSNMGKLTLDSGGNNDMVLTSTGNIDLIASGQVLCNQTPTAATAITNKIYVDNAVAAINTTNLTSKTQNIDLIETNSSKTRMTKPLEMGADALFGAVGTRFLLYTTLTQNLTSGWEFDINTTYYIKKVKISKAHISNLNQVVYFNLFKESDNSIINTLGFVLSAEDADYYYVAPANPIVLSSYQGEYKWCASTFLSTGDKIQQGSSTAPNPLLLSVYGRTNINNTGWSFPTTKGTLDFMPVIDFEFAGLYETGSQNLQALDINCRNINLSGKILTGKGPGNITDYFELSTKGYVDAIPPLFIAATDEVNSITTIGEKMRIFSPKAYVINKIKVSVNTAGGTGFRVGIFVNSSSIYNNTFGATELINTITLTDPITIAEDNPITINVLNSGGNTASGLKCYLSYN